jgi:Na+/pantothenate symporter
MDTKIQSEEKLKNKKKHSRFDNLFLDMLYNLFAWLPVTIVMWIFSNLNLD